MKLSFIALKEIGFSGYLWYLFCITRLKVYFAKIIGKKINSDYITLICKIIELDYSDIENNMSIEHGLNWLNIKSISILNQNDVNGVICRSDSFNCDSTHIFFKKNIFGEPFSRAWIEIFYTA